ncbi:MAG: rhodanese-like domain-containing protein [Lewinellaceae bacterium]|nr:rhodanese-like domain-containing protein [Lewinellaceae bacterium]
MTCKTARWNYLKNLLNNLSSEDFWKEFEQSPDAKILDVRTKDELITGILPHAIHIDFLGEDFWDRLEQLDKDDIYFVYCNSGRRSIRVCTYMTNGGFQYVFNLDGGIANLITDKLVPPEYLEVWD